jgi:hypothetical protein
LPENDVRDLMEPGYDAFIGEVRVVSSDERSVGAGNLLVESGARSHLRRTHRLDEQRDDAASQREIEP